MSPMFEPSPQTSWSDPKKGETLIDWADREDEEFGPVVDLTVDDKNS